MPVNCVENFSVNISQVTVIHINFELLIVYKQA